MMSWPDDLQIPQPILCPEVVTFPAFPDTLSMMKLYALLIGITDYAHRPLNQCVGDVHKMNAYLSGLGQQFDQIHNRTLLNADATRENVVQSIGDHLGQATDRDVALLYFSGHGAREQTGGRFPEEHDGLLDCLVCYDPADISTAQFLANKELRYCFHRLPHNPHLVTIVDACHSGDIVRMFEDPDTGPSQDMGKRIAGTFPARDYSAFLFAGDPVVERQTPGGTEVFIPWKNSVHIGACLSSESSWEDSRGGVFTRYLLSLIEATQGHLHYLDIARWARISMHGVTSKKQTPVISVQGEGPLDAYSPWLGMQVAQQGLPAGQVVNSPRGWIYNRGALLGIQEGMEVRIMTDDDETIKGVVTEVETDKAFLLIAPSDVNKLDFSMPFYPASTEMSTYTPLRVAVQDIDAMDETHAEVLGILSTYPGVMVTTPDNADIVICLFNGFAYCALPDHEFEPLAEQIRVNNSTALKSQLDMQLRALIKWHHFHSLENPAGDYDACPLRIIVMNTDGSNFDITNETHRLLPHTGRNRDGLQFCEFRVEIENRSDETLFVGVLTLNSDLSITSKPFQGKVIELGPRQSKTFYDHTQKQLVMTTLDAYKEVYNWKEEWFYYKVIFNNYEDFSTTLNDTAFLQPALPPPLTIDKSTHTLRLMAARGEGGSDYEEVRKKWGTCSARIELANADYNMISGDLKELWEDYASNTDLAPFIKELYFEDHFNGKHFAPHLRQNRLQSADVAQKATDIWYVKLFNKIYNISRHRRFKRQRHETGPVVVAEGDSWFLFPKPGVRDTLDYIMEHYRLRSLADAGDEIADYVKNNELLKAVIDEQPDYVLISGGGNDILGAEIKQILHSGVRNASDPKQYLKTEVFDQKVNALREAYTGFIEKINVLRPGVHIYLHGYDYIRSNPDARTIKNGWANRYMIEAGIHDPAHREIIIRYLVDTFNEMLDTLAGQYTSVHYVNHRGTVGVHEWMDEIHPNNTGYRKVAENFLAKMKNT